ncbi:MAG: BamA/TamA family outer membrane protein, partial [Ferruginibacter sp.]
IGVDYEWNNTNYSLNPRSGNEIKLVFSTGTKTIKKNNDILSLKDQAFDYSTLYDSIKLKSYQIRAKIIGAHYFPLGKRNTLRLSVNAGLLNSESIFRNELFQIGGFKLLRGFDEESIFATQYAVFTAEYRLLVAQNSFFYGFSDIGFSKSAYQANSTQQQFLSGGIGMVFETKNGLLNMNLAVGKRNDLPFDLRKASKIHFGYVNYF